jgi:LmbE family N-acetylglucosaminyl deacetylase
MRVPARRVIASVAAIATLLVAVQLSSPQSVSADELCSAGAALNVVAHEDDDLLFQSTTLVSDIESGLCVRTIFVTAGEADHTDAAYWQGREAGSKAAYAQMAGVADDWTTSDAGVAGYSITMETLVAAPKISLVFMRLPDSYVNGWYGNNANGESLQGLFENTVPTIHSIASPIQSYTIDQLRNTLTELMTNFQPTSINTQDFVGHYGDSDHSDHHTVAYLTLQAQAKYAAPHTFTGYRGYVIESQPANLTPSQIAQKQAIFFTYAAFDPETCDSVPACAARAEASWLQRQYEATPPIFVPGSNIAGSAVVQASSQDPTQPALAAVDGVVGGYPDDSANEWSTLGGGAGSWLSLSWASPVVLDQVVLFDRPNTADQVTGGTLTFSDGSTVVVPALTNDGSAVPISFSPRATSSVLFTVNSVSANTVNIGLAEIQTRMHEPVDLDSSTPVLTGGVKVGQTVGVSPGTWGPATVAFAYQWMRDGEPIAGATSSTYVPVNTDAGSLLSVTVTGSADYYLPTSESSAATMVTGGTLTSSAPEISGSAVVGGAVSVSAGAWGPGSVSLTYQWMRGGVAIVGATSSSFIPTVADFGKSVTVAVTGTRTGFDAATEVSDGVTIGPGALVSSVPSVSGTMVSGQVLTANSQVWGPGAVDLSYQWKRNGAAINGATGNTYTLVPADVSSVVTVTVTGIKVGYVSKSLSSVSTDSVSAPISRGAGADRYATSAAISAASFAPGVPVVYVASGEAFPDALSAAPVAGPGGGPVLLVTPSGIPASIRAELVRLKPSRIVVVGGPASITDAVYQELLSYVAQ